MNKNDKVPDSYYLARWRSIRDSEGFLAAAEYFNEHEQKVRDAMFEELRVSMHQKNNAP